MLGKPWDQMSIEEKVEQLHRQIDDILGRSNVNVDAGESGIERDQGSSDQWKNQRIAWEVEQRAIRKAIRSNVRPHFPGRPAKLATTVRGR